MKNYPIKIECLDSVSDVFTAESFDERCCTVKIDTVLSRGNVDEVLEKIREAVFMLTEPIEDEKS